MTYPLTVLLEDIWKEGILKDGGPSVKTVELCAVVERALNFMHTGNAAVLLTRLMNPLWTSQGLLTDGWPSFNPNLVRFSDGQQAKLRIKQWPFDKKTRKPISAAFAGQKFYHSAEHAAVRPRMLRRRLSSQLTLRTRHTWGCWQSRWPQQIQWLAQTCQLAAQRLKICWRIFWWRCSLAM